MKVFCILLFSASLASQLTEVSKVQDIVCSSPDSRYVGSFTYVMHSIHLKGKEIKNFNPLMLKNMVLASRNVFGHPNPQDTPIFL